MKFQITCLFFYYELKEDNGTYFSGWTGPYTASKTCTVEAPNRADAENLAKEYAKETLKKYTESTERREKYAGYRVQSIEVKELVDSIIVSPAETYHKIHSAYTRAVENVSGGPEAAVGLLLAYKVAQSVADEIANLLETRSSNSDVEKIIEGIRHWSHNIIPTNTEAAVETAKHYTNHDIALDYVGLNNRPRYTCYTCSKTLVNQPYMDLTTWTEAKDRFLAEHPCKNVRNEGIRG